MRTDNNGSDLLPRELDLMDRAERRYIACWLVGWYSRRVFDFVVSKPFIVGAATGMALAYVWGL